MELRGRVIFFNYKIEFYTPLIKQELAIFYYLRII